MKNNQYSGFFGQYSPIKQWLLPLLILGIAAGLLLFDGNVRWAYKTVFVSLLFFACMNPVINALRPGLTRSLGWSVLFFAIHAGASYLLIQWVAQKGELIDLRFFMVIVIFYCMATFLSILYRGIYLLLKDM